MVGFVRKLKKKNDRNAFQTGAKINLNAKQILGLGAL